MIRTRRRLPLLALGAISLAAGVAGGLARAGHDVAGSLALVHGPLMVSAFFGTVIGLERAVASGRRWAFAAPLSCGAGGILLIAGHEQAGGPVLALGSGLFLALMVALTWGRRDAHLRILTLGAAVWAASNAAWVGGAAISVIVIGWAAALTLTIFGERVELSRFGRPLPGKGPGAAVVAALLAVAPLFGWAAAAVAWPAFGTALLAAAAWLWRYDVARHTVRQSGLTRYVAVCLLSGYAWLAVAGLWAVAGDVALSAFAYDAVLHAVFVGFVFSMVFGHAPIILPAVLGIALPFHRSAYVALAVLHLSLVARLIGDAAGDVPLRGLGAGLNALALAGWIGLNVWLAAGASKGAR